MPTNWTSEQVIALAPDDASAKAGRGLAAVSKWETSGCDAQAVWGECKGSGKNPYQVTIDLSEPAFKCSCPSRKFPCKHGIGLFLMYAAAQIKESVPPAFCTEWLAKRAESQERKKERSETELTPEELAKKEKSKAKRVGDRETKVAAGLQELELWLADLIRQGLATAQTQPTEYWEKMAKRLVDAQAPNAARLVREMSSAVYQKNGNGKNWTDNLLEQASKIYLICDSYKRINDLPADVQADVRTAIGFTLKEDELLMTAEMVADAWQVLGVRVFEEDKLRVQRIWLGGEESRRDALILNFAFQNQPLDASFVAGTKITAELGFYPGNYPQRAFVKQRDNVRQFEKPSGCANFAEFLQNYADALSKNVWLETLPATLEKVIPVRQANDWFLRDETGEMLPLDAGFAEVWKLFAVFGNRPATVFAEWNGATLLPLTVWENGQVMRF